MTRRLALLLLAAATIQAAPISIYDGSLNTNPQAQGWSYGAASGGGGSAVESVSGGAAILTTTAPERAGFSIFSPITLDRTTGALRDYSGFGLPILGPWQTEDRGTIRRSGGSPGIGCERTFA